MTDPTTPSNAFDVLLHATGRRLTGKSFINEHGPDREGIPRHEQRKH